MFNAVNEVSGSDERFEDHLNSLSLSEARKMLVHLEQMEVHDNAPDCEREQHGHMLALGIPALKARIKALQGTMTSSSATSGSIEDQD